MNTQDQFFAVGDKVCRVAWADELGLPIHSPTEDAGFGKVLCVSDFMSDSDGNWVRFVGVPLEKPTDWWFACCFRRIEEIQLCVRAAEKFKQNEEVEV